MKRIFLPKEKKWPNTQIQDENDTWDFKTNQIQVDIKFYKGSQINPNLNWTRY